MESPENEGGAAMSTTSRRKAYIIINPVAGGGKSGKCWHDAVLALREAGIDSDWAITKGPGHAMELAEAAARGDYDMVICFGGDGTAHEVANGLLRVDSAPPLATVQSGSGNSVSQFLGFPRGYALQIAFLGSAREQRIDVGWAEYEGLEGPERRAFLLLGDAGWASTVIKRSLQFKRFGNMTTYFAAMLLEWWNVTSFPAHVTLDGTRERLQLTDLMVVNPPTGTGGMKVAPTADPTDGVLEVVQVLEQNRVGLLRVLIGLFRGTHINRPGVSLRRATDIRLEPDEPIAVALDGEFVGHTPVTFSVQPGGLKVLAGDIQGAKGS